MATEADLEHLAETWQEADGAGRRRAALLLAASSVVVLWVLAEGLVTYGRLPDQLPTHFGLAGRPDAWGQKGWFTALGPALIGAVVLVGMALLRYVPQSYNFPAKELARRLPAPARAHVYSPIQEGLSWLGSGLAIGLSLMTRGVWVVALGRRAAISPVTFLLPTAVGLVAVLLGVLVATRRARALAQELLQVEERPE